MLPTMFGCAQQGGGAAPLKVTITSVDPIALSVPPGTIGATSAAGDITSVATATGGDGSYSYAWSLSEINDPDSEYEVVSQGTTTNATYNDATVKATFNNPAPAPPPAPPPPPPPNAANYRVTCTVTDGNGDTDTASEDFDVVVV